MLKRFILPIVFLFFIFITETSAYERGLVKMKSWKGLRDHGVVKQKKDDTCGAAALATVLQMYGVVATEEEILKESAKEGWLSFEDIRASALKRLFRAAGFAGNLDLLRKLQYPVIVFLVPEKGAEHFSVVYKMDEKKVYLADPEWGRVSIEMSRFERLWRTREGNLYGRFLLILPKEGDEGDYQGLALPVQLYGNAIAMRDFIRLNFHSPTSIWSTP
jgi:predicted double-glycine peptidase